MIISTITCNILECCNFHPSRSMRSNMPFSHVQKFELLPIRKCIKKACNECKICQWTECPCAPSLLTESIFSPVSQCFIDDAKQNAGFYYKWIKCTRWPTRKKFQKEWLVVPVTPICHDVIGIGPPMHFLDWRMVAINCFYFSSTSVGDNSWTVGQ